MGLTLGPVTATPLHPNTYAPQVGRFRITQRFATPDFYWSNVDPVKAARIHGAVDIGNAQCGAAILAPADGRARWLQDNATALGAPTDALGEELRIDADWTMEFWHLGRRVAPNGGTVRKGEVLGLLGKTGLGNVCHTHIELKYRGAKVDPEPHLQVVGATQKPLPIGEEVIVNLQGKFVRHIHNRRTSVKLNDTAFRSAPFVNDDTLLKRFDAGLAFVPVVEVEGTSVGGNVRWYGGFLYVARWELGYFSEEVLQPLVPIERPEGITNEELATAVRSGARAAAETVEKAAIQAAARYKE